VNRLVAPARWPLVGLLSLLTYNTWALSGAVNGHTRIFLGYLSEFSASDQPYNLFFRTGDFVTSLVVGALGARALLVWPTLAPLRRRWWLVAAAGLLLFSLSTLLDSFFSMDCSPTLDAHCKLLEETGRLSAVHYTHTFTSVGAQTGVTASMVAAYLALLGSPLGGPRVQRAVLAVCVAEVVPLIVMMVMLAAGAPGIGYPQTLMVAVGSVWFAGVGVALQNGSVVPRAQPPAVSEKTRAR
jgi:hypothetical protein